jgi:hypothetical protein
MAMNEKTLEITGDKTASDRADGQENPWFLKRWAKYTIDI